MPTQSAADFKTRQKRAAETPKLYAVVIHNDDYTPMDFVVDLLMTIFRQNAQTAEKLMMQVHQEGSGIAGVYTFDIAVTKKREAEQKADENGHPLRFSITEEGSYN